MKRLIIIIILPASARELITTINLRSPIFSSVGSFEKKSRYLHILCKLLLASRLPRRPAQEVKQSHLSKRRELLKEPIVRRVLSIKEEKKETERQQISDSGSLD